MGKVTAIALEVLNQVQNSQLRAVDYLRVSTEEQVKGYGVAAQAKRTKGYIAKKGWSHIDTYSDEGVSGSLPWTDRPDLKRLMEDAQRDPRPFDVVVVPEGRAIGRADRAYWPWVWLLEDKGIFVADAKLDADNTTDEGRDKMREEANYAFKEYTRIRLRTQGGVQEKAEAGLYPGGKPHYGYRIEHQGKRGLSHQVPDVCDCPGECRKRHDVVVLRRARELVVEFRGDWEKAVVQLNSERLYTRSGKPWTRPNLRERLMNETVLEGRYLYRNPGNRHKRKGVKFGLDGKPIYGETVTIQLDQIFTPDEVTELRNAVQPRKRTSRNTAVRPYPLSKRMFGLCANHYVGAGHNSRRSHYYRCTGKSEKSEGAPACSCSQIDADAVDKRVWEEVCSMLGNGERLLRMAKAQVKRAQIPKVDYAKRIADYDSKIEEQDNAINIMMAAAAKQAASRNLSPAEAAKAIERAVKPLNDELAKLEEMKSEAVALQQESEALRDRASDLVALAGMARNRLESVTPEEQDRFLELLNIRVKILGPPPADRRRTTCALINWFRSRNRVIPRLTDRAWAKVEPLMQANHRSLKPRTILEAMLYKARTGAHWPEVCEMFGSPSFQMYWFRWQKSGLWEQIMAALADEDGDPPLGPAPLPPMEITGDIRPRLLLDSECREAELSPWA